MRAAVIVTALLAANTALAGRIVHPSKPDPILDGGATHPCLVGPDLVPGMDVTGQPVVPADVAAGPVPLPDQVLVPLAAGPQRQGSGRGRGRAPVTGQSNGQSNGLGGSPYVALEGRRLAPLLDPGACPR